MNNRFTTILKSKTFWGAVLGAGGYLAGQPHIGVTEVLTAGGAVISAAGIRDAFTKYLGPFAGMLPGGQADPVAAKPLSGVSTRSGF